ncbi:hypothetical protein D9M68_990680 [compost metagenome]
MRHAQRIDRDRLAGRQRLGGNDHGEGLGLCRLGKRCAGGRGCSRRRRRLAAENPCIASEREGQKHEKGCDDFGEVDHGRRTERREQAIKGKK